jgi:hypothetical protein
MNASTAPVHVITTASLPAAQRLTADPTFQAIYAVGVIEIVAGLTVALKRRFGGYLVAVWLAGIICGATARAPSSSPCALVATAGDAAKESE